MTLNFFSGKPAGSNPRYRHVITVSTWLAGRPFLSPDLVLALKDLIPHLRPNGQPESGFTRASSLKKVKGYLQARPHLPRDLVEALQVLIHELRSPAQDEFPGEDFPQGDV